VCIRPGELPALAINPNIYFFKELAANYKIVASSIAKNEKGAETMLV
jgi:hypothetical protein